MKTSIIQSTDYLSVVIAGANLYDWLDTITIEIMNAEIQLRNGYGSFCVAMSAKPDNAP